MAEKVRFPDGREVDIHDFVAFMYGLSKKRCRGTTHIIAKWKDDH